MFRLFCLIAGYVFGLFNTALFLGRFIGVDIREHGSGNAGTTNMLRVMGPKAGFTVLFGDILKAVIPILGMGFLLREAFPDQQYLIKVWTGLGVVLGHNFPFYARFKGGKGIATTAGLVVGYGVALIIPAMLAFLIPFWITHYVSLGSLTMSVFFFAAVVVTTLTGFYTVPADQRAELFILAFVISALAFVMHRENIKKLLAGKERKTYIFKKNKTD